MPARAMFTVLYSCKIVLSMPDELFCVYLVHQFIFFFSQELLIILSRKNREKSGEERRRRESESESESER